MHDQITSLIKDNYSDLNLLFAVESGSRAWNMESKNSDYDVRFVYSYTKEDYLNLFSKTKDTISTFIELDSQEIDIVGWDIYKFLKLFFKSNPSVLEWVHSPIVYIDDYVRKKLNDLANDFSRFALFKHYISMGMSQFEKYIQDKTNPSYKKYLYVLRSQFSAIYIYKFHEFPPLMIDKLLNKIEENDTDWDISMISDEVGEIIAAKQNHNEETIVTVSPALNFWIIETFDALENIEPEMKEKEDKSSGIDEEALENILTEVLERTD